MLAHRAAASPDTVAYTFQKQPRTFRQMWQGINQTAAALGQQGVTGGDRLLLALPNSHEFFDAFYGVQLAGGIAVPIFPGFSPERILAMVKLCGARIIFLPSATPEAQLETFRRDTASLGLTILTVDGCRAAPERAAFPAVQPDDVAFIQYTSGSTGDPKGVQLSHRNLLLNLEQMIAGMEITADEIFVSWLPVYHDMGLILKTMVPFYLGAQVHLLPTSLRTVEPWLEAIQSHKATFTAAPDFAYRLLLRHIDNPGDYDLSSLRVALNAAEPVRSQTIEEFEAAFGLKQVMVAGYGLAEATVGVSMAKPNTPPLVDSRGLVSAGRPFPGVSLSILQGDALAPPGEVGEILINSVANSRGYFNNEAGTAALYYDPHTIHSGDLGYLDEEGNLFIAGRLKNIIIHAGHSVYPQEIEELYGDITLVRFTAAVGIDRGDIAGEQVYIFAEVRGDHSTPQETWQQTAIKIVSRFYHRFGFRPARVLLLTKGSIPITHNSKLRHNHLRELYLSGALRDQNRILYS